MGNIHGFTFQLQLVFQQADFNLIKMNQIAVFLVVLVEGAAEYRFDSC